MVLYQDKQLNLFDCIPKPKMPLKIVESQELTLDGLWMEDSPDYILSDEWVASYSQFEIYLGIPNGGILSVSILFEGHYWSACSESLMADLHHNKQWHVEQAKRFINHYWDGEHEALMDHPPDEPEEIVEFDGLLIRLTANGAELA